MVKKSVSAWNMLWLKRSALACLECVVVRARFDYQLIQLSLLVDCKKQVGAPTVPSAFIANSGE
jgi:hypothetical protein